MPKLPFDAAEAIKHLSAADPILGELILRKGECKLILKPTKSLFEALLNSIIYQQLHAKAASSIHERVLALFPRKHPTPEGLLALSDEALRTAGLSRGKLASLHDLAAKTIDGTVPTFAAARKLSDEELIERLTAVRGIGPWTVHMLLIFRLGRPDILPTGDYAVRKGFQLLYKKRRDPSHEHMVKHTKHWRPYRTIASWYLWRSLE